MSCNGCSALHGVNLKKQLGSDKGIPDVQISGQSPINEHCHNSRTNTQIKIKLGPVTKLDKRNTTISENCVIVIFSIYDQL